MDNESVVDRNRALQTEWYGEPLGERFRRLLDRLRLSQAQLAGVLGLSAPMVSQLMTGVRAKIANPAVLARLAALEELADDPDFLARPPEERRTELTRLAAEPVSATGTFGHGRSSGATGTIGALSPSRTGEGDQGSSTLRPDPAVAVQALLRAVATASEIEEAARLLDARHPALAEVLRTYGTMRTAEARAHYGRVVEL